MERKVDVDDDGDGNRMMMVMVTSTDNCGHVERSDWTGQWQEKKVDD